MWIRGRKRMEMGKMWKSIFWIGKEYRGIKGERDRGRRGIRIKKGIVDRV